MCARQVLALIHAFRSNFFVLSRLRGLRLLAPGAICVRSFFRFCITKSDWFEPPFSTYVQRTLTRFDQHFDYRCYFYSFNHDVDLYAHINSTAAAKIASRNAVQWPMDRVCKPKERQSEHLVRFRSLSSLHSYCRILECSVCPCVLESIAIRLKKALNKIINDKLKRC